MSFLVTLIFGLFLILLEPVVLSVFQVESWAFQIFIALSVAVAWERPPEEGGLLVAFWLIPAYNLLLIPDYRWLLSFVVVFVLAEVIARQWRSEQRLFQFLTTLVLLSLGQLVFVFLSWVSAPESRQAEAALKTILYQPLITTIFIAIIAAFLRWMDKRFFEKKGLHSYR